MVHVALLGYVLSTGPRSFIGLCAKGSECTPLIFPPHFFEGFDLFSMLQPSLLPGLYEVGVYTNAVVRLLLLLLVLR